MHVKKGDKVIVIAGKHKGETSTIARAIPSENKVVLEGLNKVKRHMRPRKQGEKGGIVEIPAPIHVSNVKLAEKVSKSEKKPVAKKAAKKTAKKEE
jgi:large subunit ribosomal protein L24